MVRKNKYGVAPKINRTDIDGTVFASKGEMIWFRELRLLEMAGQIKNLKGQVKYRIEINGFHVCDYIADAVYEQNGIEVVADFKGHVTDIFSIKRKLMKAVLGIDVIIFKSAKNRRCISGP